MIPYLVTLTALQARRVGLAALAELSVHLPFRPLESVFCVLQIYVEKVCGENIRQR